MPPLHAYTSLCTVQLHQRVVKVAGPCPLLNACFTALCTHRFARPLARLSTWSLVHMAPHPLLLLIMQVPLDLQAWPMVLPTLRVVFTARNAGYRCYVGTIPAG